MVAKTVLVVEDDPPLRIVAEEMFAAAGFEVESVQRADQAVDRSRPNVGKSDKALVLPSGSRCWNMPTGQALTQL
jgi:CheY-like chemotaxis protein